MISKKYAKTIDMNMYIFFLSGFSFTNFTNHGTVGKWGGHFFNSSLPLPCVSQTLRHQPGDYCRELTSRQQPDSNWKPLVSERKSRTIKLRAPKLPYFICKRYSILYLGGDFCCGTNDCPQKYSAWCTAPQLCCRRAGNVA